MSRNKPDQPVRQRLVLITTPLEGEAGQEALRRALSGGDVASVLVDPAGRENAAFQDHAEPLVTLSQEAGAAAIVIDDTRCAGRVQADGIHITSGGLEGLSDGIEAYAAKMIVGASGFETRHEALEAGELMPDYILFGRLGQDSFEEPHPKTLSMSEWWAQIVEVPCIALGAKTLQSAETVAATGAEFIALSAAIFDEAGEEAAKVSAINRMLDERFEVAKREAEERASA